MHYVLRKAVPRLRTPAWTTRRTVSRDHQQVRAVMTETYPFCSARMNRGVLASGARASIGPSPHFWLSASLAPGGQLAVPFCHIPLGLRQFARLLQPVLQRTAFALRFVLQ